MLNEPKNKRVEEVKNSSSKNFSSQKIKEHFSSKLSGMPARPFKASLPSGRKTIDALA
jgi:hypothetical protein